MLVVSFRPRSFLQPIIPGKSMANASMAKPFSISAPANPIWLVSISLSGQKTGQVLSVSAQLMALVSTLGSLSRVALSFV